MVIENINYLKGSYRLIIKCECSKLNKMRCGFTPFWIFGLLIIIFHYKINYTHATPVTKIVSWYSQIHPKDILPEIFVQNEEKEEIGSTTTLYKKANRHEEQVLIKNNASAIKELDTGNVQQGSFKFDDVNSYSMRPEHNFNGSFNDDAEVKRTTKLSFYTATPGSNVNIKLVSQARKVKRLKNNDQTAHPITTRSANMTESALKSNSKSALRKLYLKSGDKLERQSPLNSTVNIKDPKLLKSLKQMDLSILSYPPAFMYRNSDKQASPDGARVVKRFIPGLQCYLEDSPVADVRNTTGCDLRKFNYYRAEKMAKLQDRLSTPISDQYYRNADHTSYMNNLKQCDNSSFLSHFQVENSPNLHNNVKVPSMKENDSCIIIDTPVLAVGPGGLLTKLNTNNKLMPKSNSDLKENKALSEVMNKGTIPVQFVKELNRGYDLYKLNQNLNRSRNVLKAFNNMSNDIPYRENQGFAPEPLSFNNSNDATKDRNVMHLKMTLENLHSNNDNNTFNSSSLIYKVPKEIILPDSARNSTYWDKLLVQVGKEKFTQNELTEMKSYLHSNNNMNMTNSYYNDVGIDENASKVNNPTDLEVIRKLMNELLQSKMFSSVNVQNTMAPSTETNATLLSYELPAAPNFRTPFPFFVTKNDASFGQPEATWASTMFDENELRQTSTHLQVLGLIYASNASTSESPLGCNNNPQKDKYPKCDSSKFNLNVYLNYTPGLNNTPTTTRPFNNYSNQYEFTTDLFSINQNQFLPNRFDGFTVPSTGNRISKMEDVKHTRTHDQAFAEIKSLLTHIKYVIDNEICKENNENVPDVIVRRSLADNNVYHIDTNEF